MGSPALKLHPFWTPSSQQIPDAAHILGALHCSSSVFSASNARPWQDSQMQATSCTHLIHAVDADMRQERPQIGVRQDIILRDPRHHLQCEQRSLHLCPISTIPQSVKCCKSALEPVMGFCGLNNQVQASGRGEGLPVCWRQG